MTALLPIFAEEPLPLPPLAEVVLDIYRHPVDLRGDLWKLNVVGSYQTKLDWLDVPFLGAAAVFSFKHYVAYGITRLSPINSGNAFRRLRDVFVLLGVKIESIEEIDANLCVKARNACKNAGREYQFNEFRSWYCYHADMDFPGASYELATVLRSWTIPGNTKGEAVLSWDEDIGPLDDHEFQALNAVLAIDDSDAAVLVSVFLELGCNPRNVCFLEERDLHIFGNREEAEYQLDVFRIKKSFDHRETKRRSISARLGRALQRLILGNRLVFGEPDPLRPIFCRKTENESLPKSMVRYRFHYAANDLTAMVRGYAKSRGIMSRNMVLLLLTPRRLRYTFAARLAEAGAAPVTLAELLDHTDLQNVMVYYKASSKIADRLEQALHHGVGEVWRRFRGEVVAKPNPILEKIIGDTHNVRDVGGIGSCGSKGACHKSVPYSCYVCPSFQAWKDAPHQKLLDGLIAERDKHIALGANNQTNRIPRQNEQIILAVEDLLSQLKKEGA